MTRFYVKDDDLQKGPYTRSQILSMWQTGVLTCETQVRSEDSTHWLPTEDFLSRPSATFSPDNTKETRAITPAHSDKAARLLAVGMVFTLAFVFFGFVHIITGGSLSDPLIVRKKSFGLSETFINIDQIARMPWNAARARFPLGCAVLVEQKLISTTEIGALPRRE